MDAATEADGNPLAQLEQSWGKLRDSWSIEDWRKAAELLEKSMVIVGRQADTALRLGMAVAEANSSITKPRRRGRPKKPTGGMMRVKPKQSLQDRYKNFGKRETKFDKLAQMCLVATVLREGGKDNVALKAIVGRITPARQRGVVETEVRRKWAPQLSKARKELTDKDREVIAKWLEKNR